MDREAYIAGVIGMLRAELDAAGIKGEVTGRPKHIYSIWRKMQKKGVGLEDLFDVRAVRVLVNDVEDCYTVLGLVHNLWTPVAREFDDYIARPTPIVRCTRRSPGRTERCWKCRYALSTCIIMPNWALPLIGATRNPRRATRSSTGEFLGCGTYWSGAMILPVPANWPNISGPGCSRTAFT
jgi:hypothetical protein